MKLLLSNNEVVEINTRKDFIRCFLDHPDDKNCLNLIIPYSADKLETLYEVLSDYYHHSELDKFKKKSIKNIVLEETIENSSNDNSTFNKIFSPNVVKKAYFNKNNLNFVSFKYNNSTNSITVSGLLFKDFKKAINDNNFYHLNTKYICINNLLSQNIDKNIQSSDFFTTNNMTFDRSFSRSDSFYYTKDYFNKYSELRDVCVIIKNLIEKHYSFCTYENRINNETSNKIIRLLNTLYDYSKWNNDKSILSNYLIRNENKIYLTFDLNNTTLESYVENIFDIKQRTIKRLSKFAVKDYVKLDLPDFIESDQATDRYKPTYKAINDADRDTVDTLNKSLEKCTSNIKDTVNIILKHFATLYDDDPNIKIVEGFEIAKYYNVLNYKSKERSLGSSCMRHTGFTNEHTEVYCMNPEVCKMMVYSNEKNQTLARALLWYADGKKYMDRVFYSDEKFAKKMTIYANNNNFIGLYTNNNAGVVFNNYVTCKDNVIVNLKPLYYNMPYLDSMNYYDVSIHRLSNRPFDKNSVNVNCHNAGASHCSYVSEISVDTNIISNSFKNIGRYKNIIFHPTFGYIGQTFEYNSKNTDHKSFLDLKVLTPNNTCMNTYTYLFKNDKFIKIPYLDTMIDNDKYCLLIGSSAEFYFIDIDTVNNNKNKYNIFDITSVISSDSCKNITKTRIHEWPLFCKIHDRLLQRVENKDINNLPTIVYDKTITSCTDAFYYLTRLL